MKTPIAMLAGLALYFALCIAALGQVTAVTEVDKVYPANGQVEIVVDSNAKFVDVEAKKDLFDTVTRTYDLGPENVRNLVLKAEKLEDLKAEISKAPRRFLFTGAPARYLVTIRHYDPDLGIKTESYTVVIGTPAPTPKPDDPTPNPKPDDPTPVPAGDLAGKIKAALLKVPTATRDKMVDVRQGDGHTTQMKAAVAFGNQYLDIGGEAASNPSAWDVATMVNEAKVRTAGVIPTADLAVWRQSFIGDLNKAVSEEGLASADVAKAAQIFKTVGQVLTTN